MAIAGVETEIAAKVQALTREASASETATATGVENETARVFPIAMNVAQATAIGPGARRHVMEMGVIIVRIRPVMTAA